MGKSRVLFICVHNSARSQMAEAWLNYVCGEFFEAQSAGPEPGTINPLVTQAMMEVGIDLTTSGHKLSSMCRNPESCFNMSLPSAVKLRQKVARSFLE